MTALIAILAAVGIGGIGGMMLVGIKLFQEIEKENAAVERGREIRKNLNLIEKCRKDGSPSMLDWIPVLEAEIEELKSI